MPLDELTLTLNPSGEAYEYQLKYIQGEDPNQTKSAVSIAPPGQAAADNILLGIQGQEADITIRWMARDDGSDKANGTAPTSAGFENDTVVTRVEQKRWLREYIHAPDFDAAWTLTHSNGEIYDSASVFVEKVNTPILSVENRRWNEWSVGLRRGESLS